MTIYSAGALNTTALVTPGLYTIVIPPSLYLLNGVPTNIAGLVGTASWGPVGVPVAVSGIPQYTQNFGSPNARKYDMGSALFAAQFQGNAAAYKCVRVTDGTDVAATAVIGAIGTAGVAAAGTVTFVSNPVAATTLTLNGSVWTFVAALTSGLQILIGTALANTLANAASVLGYSTDTNTALNTYSASATVLSLTAKATGTTGNAFTLATTVAGATVSAATMLGGVASTQGVVISSLYTGSAANADTAIVGNGTKTGTYKLTLTHVGLVPEIYDNIGFGLTGAAVYTAIAAAVNLGNSPIRGPSVSFLAVAGGATTAPTLATTTLAGGTDGVTTINGATLLGSDSIPRKGMYAMRAQGISVAALVDCDDYTTYSTQIPFGIAEGIYMIATTPSGDTIANAINVKAAAGVDSYALRLSLGDWVMINDTINTQQRFISPQGFIVGMLANMTPQNSTLNKAIQGIVTTQKTQYGSRYSDADLQLLSQAGIDVITNPIPAGALFGARIGRNSSSNAVIHGDNYTRMTNYIASTINAGMGIFVGQLQGTSPTDTTRLQAKTTLDAFGQALIAANMVVAWSTVLDLSNNPANQIALGYMQAYVRVTYLSVVEYFIISVEGGQSVSVTTSTVAPF